MMAKGFVIGMQFEALFQDELFFELGRHANQMAEKIAKVLQNSGYPFYATACSNQLFPILPNEVLEQLSKNFVFSEQAKIDENHSAIRFVTSWATTEENVDALCEFLLSKSAK
jgi:threonine aldolase